MLEPPPQYRNRAPRFTDAAALTSIGPDRLGREAWLEPNTARAWQAMRAAAAAAGICLWEIAEVLGVTDSTFSRKLRRELPENEKEAVFRAIERMKEYRAKRAEG